MINNFIKPGLTDLAISRTTFDWGIQTFDDKHVVYVWLDALMNYITGLGYDVDGNNGELFEKYLAGWPTPWLVRTLSVSTPSTGLSSWWPWTFLCLNRFFGHPWLLVGDNKMGKSKGNVIYVDDLRRSLGLMPSATSCYMKCHSREMVTLLMKWLLRGSIPI